MGFRLFLRDGLPPCWASDVLHLALWERAAGLCLVNHRVWSQWWHIGCTSLWQDQLFIMLPWCGGRELKWSYAWTAHSITQDGMHRNNGSLQDYSHRSTVSCHWPHSPSIMNRGRGQSFLLQLAHVSRQALQTLCDAYCHKTDNVICKFTFKNWPLGNVAWWLQQTEKGKKRISGLLKLENLRKHTATGSRKAKKPEGGNPNI